MLQVPLVIKFPKDMQVAPARIDALSSLLDVFPSLCAWLDVAALQHLDGRPLAGLFGQPEDPDRELYLRSFQREPTLGLRGAHTKVILGPGRNGNPERGEFFDLTSDPQERRAVAIRKGGTGTELLSRLLELQSGFEALNAGSVRDAEPTEAEQALIRELGYAE